MRYVWMILVMAGLLGCASKKPRYIGSEADVVKLTIDNRFNRTVEVFYKMPGTRPVFLGKVKKGQKRTLAIHGPFDARGFSLFAHPLHKRPLRATLPVRLEHGKNVVWVLSAHKFAYEYR